MNLVPEKNQKKLSELLQLLAVLPILNRMGSRFDGPSECMKETEAVTTVGLNVISELYLLNGKDRNEVVVSNYFFDFMCLKKVHFVEMAEAVIRTAIEFSTPQKALEVVNEIMAMGFMTQLSKEDVEKKFASVLCDYFLFVNFNTLHPRAGGRYLKLMSNHCSQDWMDFLKQNENKVLRVNSVQGLNNTNEFIENFAISHNCDLATFNKIVELNKIAISDDLARKFNLVKQCALKGNVNFLNSLCENSELEIFNALISNTALGNTQDFNEIHHYLEKKYSVFFALCQITFTCPEDKIAIDWMLSKVHPQTARSDLELINSTNLLHITKRKDLLDMLVGGLEHISLSDEFGEERKPMILAL